MVLNWRHGGYAVFVVLCVAGLGSIALAASHTQPKINDDALTIERMIVGSYTCAYMEKEGSCGGTDWILTVQSDGSRNLRAFQSRPAAQSQMNGFWRMDRNFRPMEAFINVTNNVALLGSAFYTVDDSQMTAHVSTPQGLSTEVVDVPDDFSLLLHPIPADGWHFVTYDFDKGGVQTKPICVLGAAGPSPLCKVVDFKLEYLGDETLTVPAGTFATKHFRFGDAAEIWVTDDEDRHVIRHEFSGLDTRYVLSSLESR